MERRDNFYEIIAQRSITHPDQKILSFVLEQEVQTWTYRQLHNRICSIAAYIQTRNKPGDRILILLPPSLDYVAAYFACLYTDCVSIPLFPARNYKENERLLHLSADADCETAIIDVARDNNGLKNFKKIEIEKISHCPDLYKPLITKSSDIAYLQYTSGSTASPKGVMVSHGNLIANCDALEKRFYRSDIKIGCSWLPFYHDMGLIGGILFPIYSNYRAILFSPYRFIKSPLTWMEIISQYKVNITPAPNFAYDLIARELEKKSKDINLDLSSLKIAVNGSEPINSSTMKIFLKATEPYGIKNDVMFPSYGLAEATLLITSRKQDEKNKILKVDKQALANRKVVPIKDTVFEYTEFVSCGRVLKNHRLIIANPRSRKKLNSFEIGEIWLSGPSITKGYWKNTTETAKKFNAKPINDELYKNGYLRTGDLGFQDDDGNLYVTGRIKDVIIIRGKNYYPQDIEYAIEQSHPDLVAHGGVAISLKHNKNEYIAIIHEVKRHTKNFDDIFLAIQNCIIEEFEITVERIILIQRGSLPKTTSGKIRRYACKENLKKNKLKIVSDWKSPRISDNDEFKIVSNIKTLSPGKTNKSPADEIIDWLREYTEKRINSRLMDERRSIFPYIILDLAKHGLFGLQIPKAYGGLELSTHDSLRIMQQLSAIDPSLALLVGNHTSLGVNPILWYATEEMKAQLLPEMAVGKALGAMGITEPETGSQFSMISAKAVEFGKNKWQINGIKRWNASGWANIINVFVQLNDPVNETNKLTGFILTQDLQGISIGPESLTMGWRGFAQTPLYLKNVIVNKSLMLGQPGEGMEIINNILTSSRLGIATLSVGIMKRAMQLMYRYASRRKISTQLLLESKVFLNFTTDIISKINILETLINTTSTEVDLSLETPIELALASKILASEFVWQTVDIAMQMTGGRGFLENNILPQLLRDCRAFRIVEGANEPLAIWLGRTAFHTEIIYHLLRTKFNNQTLADEHKNLGIKLNDVYQKNLNEGYYSLFFYLYGMITCHYIARCAIEKKLKFSNDEFIKFSNKYFKKLTRVLCENIINLHGDVDNLQIKDIKEILKAHEKSIGNLEQHGYDEDRDLDDLFSKEWHAEKIKEVIHSNNVESVNQQKIIEWVTHWISEKLNIEIKKIKKDLNLIQLGLDSLYLMRFSHDVEKKYSTELTIEKLWENPTIEGIAFLIETNLVNRKTDNILIDNNITKEQAEKLLSDIDNLSDENIEALIKILEKQNEIE